MRHGPPTRDGGAVLFPAKALRFNVKLTTF